MTFSLGSRHRMDVNIHQQDRLGHERRACCCSSDSNLLPGIILHSISVCIFTHPGHAFDISNPICRGNDFVRKYHWPKCVIPSATSLIVDFQKTSQGRFCIDSVEDFGVRKYHVCIYRLHGIYTCVLITVDIRLSKMPSRMGTVSAYLAS